MTMVDAGALLREGFAAHQAGQLDVAEAAYRAVLAEAPDHQTPLHLLGLVALQQGRLDEAITLLRRVLEIEPGAADAWMHLVTACRFQARFEAEADALDHLIALQPDHAEAIGRRGVLAFEAGDVDGACDWFARAVALTPSNADAWTNLGACQLILGRLADAEASQRRAVAVDPTSATALHNLGNVLVARSCWAEAAVALERFVRHMPGDAKGWINFGHALKGLKRYDEAYTAYERALALQPDHAVALLGLGDALQGLDRPGEAIPYYERSLAGFPDNADTYEHYGVALQTVGRLQEAEQAYRRCLELDPDRARVHSGLIFALDLHEGAEDEAQVERRSWNARFGRAASVGVATHGNLPNPERRLRVGYVSADFRHHSAAYAIVPILRAHDRANVEVVCYSGVTTPDHVTSEIRALADRWREAADLSDDALAAQVRADEIDVLVDLSGHTGGNRLLMFARKPAPIQVTAWGYAAGTGLDAMDYFLADPITVPNDSRASFPEQIVDLPGVLCYEPPSFAPAVAPLPAATHGYVTFGAFNRLQKISERALAAWAAVLAAVPSARLTIKCAGADAAPGRDRLLARLGAHGVSAERVTLLGGTPHPQHLAAHGEIDLMLDTFPQNGGITTLDALLMGVPVVTLLGERVPGRMSASFLSGMGLTDLIAPTTDDYVAIAARLASDLDRLAHERATLRDRLLDSPVGNAALYAQAVEVAYREMWKRWCEGRGAKSEGRGANEAGAMGSTGDTVGTRNERGGTSGTSRIGVTGGPARRGFVRAARAGRAGQADQAVGGVGVSR